MLALRPLRSLFLRLQTLSSSVDSYRIFGRAERRSHASLLCCAVYRPFLPRTWCRGSRQSFRRLRLRLSFAAFPPRVAASDGRRLVAAAGGLLSVSRCGCSTAGSCEPFQEHPSSLPACVTFRLALSAGPDPPVPLTGTVVRISTKLPEGSLTSASVRNLGPVRTGHRSQTDLLFPMETRHRDYCLVLLFSSSSTQDVGSRSVSILSAPLTCGLGLLFQSTTTG